MNYLEQVRQELLTQLENKQITEEEFWDYYFLECWQEVSDVVFEFVKFQCDLKEKTK